MSNRELGNVESAQLARTGPGSELIPMPKIGRLNTFKSVATELRHIYKEARTGRMPAAEACRLAYLLRELGQIMAVTVIESRLERLEGKGAGDGADDEV